MFEVVYYEDKPGASSLYEQIAELSEKANTNKDARIQYTQISFLLELLQEHGTKMISNYTKRIEGDIWELRPGNNRILYFFYKENTYVLLHMFRKKTRKTPQSEIEKAKRERNDYLLQRGGDKQ